MNIKDLTTEQRNPDSLHIDSATPLEIVKIINQEDKKLQMQLVLKTKKLPKPLNMHQKDIEKEVD